MARLAAANAWAVRHVGLIAFAAVLVAFAGSAVHLDRYDQVRDGRPGATEQGTPAARQDDASSEARAEVGPRIGQELGPYLEARTGALADHDDGEAIRAVVSFTRYLEAAEVEAPEGIVVEAVQIRVPVADVAPAQQAVEDGELADAVATAVAREREALQDEERDLRTTLESDVGDLAFEQDFERRLEELADLDGALGEDAPVVFAVVVSGVAAELRAFADHADVRLVDPGGRQAETTRSRFYGLLPDDTVRATHGRPL